jgi:hypothetical protein
VRWGAVNWVKPELCGHHTESRKQKNWVRGFGENAGCQVNSAFGEGVPEWVARVGCLKVFIAQGPSPAPGPSCLAPLMLATLGAFYPMFITRPVLVATTSPR